MAPIALETEDHQRDAAFNKVLHGKSAEERAGFMSMLKKDPKAQKLAVDEYFKHWDEKHAGTETEEVRKARKDEYATLTRHYYNLVTDLYEYGWGASFHFCRFGHAEPFYQAIARHEQYLAHRMSLRDGMKVLDVGCGVGGPARQIATFSGANIIGLNNNDYQIERASRYTAKAGLANQVSFTKGDFMQMSFSDNTFDAIYAIEATVHAPSLEDVYSEIFRVLKPGGVFGVYEWLLTAKYDDTNAAHRQIRLDIEQGDGISNMEDVASALRAIEAAGFVLEHHEDLAHRPDVKPWYWPLAGEFGMMGSLWDLPTIARMHPLGRKVIHAGVGILERIGIAQKGTQKTADSLAKAAVALVDGGRQDLFTPMYMMIARKPER